MTAADRAVHEVRVADVDAANAVTDRVDPAGGLVTEHERRSHQTMRVRFEVVEDRDVGVARTGARDLQPHVTGTRFGDVDVLDASGTS